jgi:hypothetical protein
LISLPLSLLTIILEYHRSSQRLLLFGKYYVSSSLSWSAKIWSIDSDELFDSLTATATVTGPQLLCGWIEHCEVISGRSLSYVLVDNNNNSGSHDVETDTRILCFGNNSDKVSGDQLVQYWNVNEHVLSQHQQHDDRHMIWIGSMPTQRFDSRFVRLPGTRSNEILAIGGKLVEEYLCQRSGNV